MRYFHGERGHTAFHTFLLAGVFSLIALFCALCLYCICVRIVYPFELDWIEGEIMCHVVRLLDGTSMYPAPSMEFVAEIYPPVYYLTTAVFTKIFGIGMLAGRAVSVVATLVVVVLLFQVGKRETGSRIIAALGAGLFVALYHVHGPWYDLARVDMLFFAFLIAACYVIAYHTGTRWGILVAVALMVLACYTKQNGIVYLGFAALYLVVADRNKGLVFICLSVGILCGIFVGLNAVTEGWFGKYTFFNLVGYKNNIALSQLSAYQQVIEDIKAKLPVEIRYELCYKLPVLSTMFIVYLSFRLFSFSGIRSIVLWEYMALAGGITYFLVRPHPGSEKNDLMHLTLWSCILVGRGYQQLGCLLDKRWGSAARCTALLLLCVQLGLVVYDPRINLPAPGSVEKGREFISLVKNMEGEVYIPYHSFYGYMAGKKMVFNAGAFWGFQFLSPGTYEPHDLITRINEKYFSAIIIDEISYYVWLGQRIPFDNIALLLKAGEPLSQAIEKNYRYERRIEYRHTDEFRNPTGFMTRPEIILVPKS